MKPLVNLLTVLAIPAALYATSMTPPISDPSAAGADPMRLPFVQEMRWHGWTADGQVVEVNNVLGDVQVESTNSDEIEVVARKRGSGDPQQVLIEVVEHKGGVTVCAVYPQAKMDHPFDCRPSHGGGFRVADSSPVSPETHIRWENGGGGDVMLNDMRVDFVVRLPKRLRFIGRTVDGDVASHLVDQDIEAHSVLGDVTVDVDSSNGGEIRAESAQGAVSSDLAPLNIKSGHGNFVNVRFGHSHRIVKAKSATGNIRLLGVRVL